LYIADSGGKMSCMNDDAQFFLATALPDNTTGKFFSKFQAMPNAN